MFELASNSVTVRIDEPLPGSMGSVEEAWRGDVALAAVCMAVGEPKRRPGYRGGEVPCSQPFSIEEVLFGAAPEPDQIVAGYCAHARFLERPILKGERVVLVMLGADHELWLDWYWSFNRVANPPQWVVVKALPDTESSRQAVLEAAAEAESAWGPVSDDLQCRLLPVRQRLPWHDQAWPDSIPLTLDIRNVGETERRLPYRQTNAHASRLWDVRFCVTDQAGSELERDDLGFVLPAGFSRRMVYPTVISPGSKHFVSFSLRQRFGAPGVHRVGARRASMSETDGESVLKHYNGDAEKARQNPDNIWTGTLESNTVTVEMVRTDGGRNPAPE